MSNIIAYNGFAMNLSRFLGRTSLLLKQSFRTQPSLIGHRVLNKRAHSSTQSMPVLQGKEDHYGGFIVDPHLLPANVSEFEDSLDTSLFHWKERYKGIWIKLKATDHVHLIESASKRGFEFHHAGTTVKCSEQRSRDCFLLRS